MYRRGRHLVCLPDSAVVQRCEDFGRTSTMRALHTRRGVRGTRRHTCSRLGRLPRLVGHSPRVAFRFVFTPQSTEGWRSSLGVYQRSASVLFARRHFYRLTHEQSVSHGYRRAQTRSLHPGPAPGCGSGKLRTEMLRTRYRSTWTDM